MVLFLGLEKTMQACNDNTNIKGNKRRCNGSGGGLHLLDLQ
jgi:hypothetical protein